jgi:hypothetical protein
LYNRAKILVLFVQKMLLSLQIKVTVDKPDPPVVGKVTHHSIELTWTNVKEKLPANQRFKFVLQEADKAKKEWGNVYS